jgi:CheY-like chemotaxis protein
VALALESAGGMALIRVEDRGAGIEPRMLPRLYDPFVQAEQTPERPAGGLGMGLPLVKGIAELHGGTVEGASPGLGGGSVFALRLPLSQALVPAPPEPTRAPPAARQVLVVEDNPDVANALALLLRVLGQRVHTVADGPAALEAAERLRPDLILLDLGLPGMDGFEVAHRLRKSAHGRTARLVAVTGYGQESDALRARAAGFDAHVPKPMGKEDLLEALSRCPLPAASATHP